MVGRNDKGPLTKTNAPVNGGALSNAVDWLVKNAPPLTPAINKLLALPAVQSLLPQTDQQTVAWWRRWFAWYTANDRRQNRNTEMEASPVAIAPQISYNKAIDNNFVSRGCPLGAYLVSGISP